MEQYCIGKLNDPVFHTISHSVQTGRFPHVTEHSRMYFNISHYISGFLKQTGINALSRRVPLHPTHVISTETSSPDCPHIKTFSSSYNGFFFLPISFLKILLFNSKVSYIKCNNRSKLLNAYKAFVLPELGEKGQIYSYLQS